MPQRLALKRLTASDLTFFEWQFTNRNAGNQKAINLNADVFIDNLYPSLPNIAYTQGGRIPLDLYLYGPGLGGEYNLQRKIVKGETYKNWRLNGEFVFNPPDQPERFNVISPGDLAVIEFGGDLSPHSARIVFIASTIIEDASLHVVLDRLLGNSRMVALTSHMLEQSINEAKPLEQHPIHDLILDNDLEDAALGGIQGIRHLQARAARRRISPDALQQARESASRIGRAGEEFVNCYLVGLQRAGVIQGIEWIADINAVSPYDFRVNSRSGSSLVEVKSTEGDFENPIHISFNELWQMREAPERYDLYRVYGMVGHNAQVRITEDLRGFATTILEILERLPDGVRSDSISVLPEVLSFGEPITLHLTVDDE